MKAITTSGKAFKATHYNTSTVTLATRSGKPDIVSWHDLSHVIGDDGLERHREVVNGMPTIIVQSPPDPRWQPYLGKPQEPRECPQNDFEGAADLIDLIETAEEREAVRAMLTASFAGDEKAHFWNGLSDGQKDKLRIRREVPRSNL
jgi:hypothetical protein